MKNREKGFRRAKAAKPSLGARDTGAWEDLEVCEADAKVEFCIH